ncbi:MAG: PKD domain-containing protein [Candidatus Aminicenantes bacterium]|nr:PKD domain-containing protein [Candidatus Aminicenantes bacterium]
MKKALFCVSILFFVALSLPAAILTNPSSGTANVGDNMGFRLTCTDPASARWEWGDGKVLTGVPANQDWRYHAYRNPGTYQVHMNRYNFTATPSCPGMGDEYRTVTILENRTITTAPAQPVLNQPIVFTANNFRTPSSITWNMGDGTVYAIVGNQVTHTYAKAGNYIVKAYDWRGDTTTTPVTLTLAFTRGIVYSPEMPRVDQAVALQALGFASSSIDWNFGDGTPETTYSAMVSHRYQNSGTFTITAKEHGLMDIMPASKAITVLPENRSLQVSPAEARVDEPVTFVAVNFRGQQVFWDFGDGKTVSGPSTTTHAFTRPGNYTVTARDENGASQKPFQAAVRILGISDQVNLEIAELSLDNGKYYKVVPKNSKNIRALLRMKLRGTGIVSGYWIVDGRPYEFFNETTYQGQVKTIATRGVPGLPMFDPGMHTVTVELTRPVDESAVFPTLRYYVLPFENTIDISALREGAVVKEDETAEFSWKSAPGGSYYQIAFSEALVSLLSNDPELNWIDCPERFRYTPDAETWKALKRNRWTYWKVRAVDSGGSVVAESDIREFKVIVPGAEVGIRKITDMEGRPIVIGNSFTATRAQRVMIHGGLTYPAEAEYLILRVYANDSMVDQLLFRDVKKDEMRPFETSVPNLEKESRVTFEVLKASSPSLIVGFRELRLKRE